jgi:putative membrane protein
LKQSRLCVTDGNRDQLSVSGLRLDPHRLGSGAVRIEVAEREVVGSLRVDMDNELVGTVLDGEALDLTESITRLDLNDEPLNPLSLFVAVGVPTPCGRQHDDKRDQHRTHLSKVTDHSRTGAAQRAHLADPKPRTHRDRDWARSPRLLVVAVVLFLLVPSHAIAQSGEPEVGRDVFQTNCAMCHGADASGMMGMHPSLRGAVERLTVEGVEVTVRNGRDTMPPMPAFASRLTDQEINDVIAYLDTLPVGPRNFGAEGDGIMDMDGMMDGGMWSWFAWSVLFLVVLAAVVIASIFVIRAMWSRGGTSRESGSRALEILKERFARGEIDRQEFEERRRLLGD